MSDKIFEDLDAHLVSFGITLAYDTKIEVPKPSSISIQLLETEVGTSSLQRLDNVSMGAVYFIEHRQIQAAVQRSQFLESSCRI